MLHERGSLLCFVQCHIAFVPGVWHVVDFQDSMYVCMDGRTMGLLLGCGHPELTAMAASHIEAFPLPSAAPGRDACKQIPVG